MKCSELIKQMEILAPQSMACEWDNPGLLAGRSDKEVETVFLALDATDEVIEQAIEHKADLILTHHPLIFKPLKQVTDQELVGRRIIKMIQHDISYYAMHTNFDAAPGCMGDLAGKRLGLSGTRVLEPMGTLPDGREYGIGVKGVFKKPMPLKDAAELVKTAFGLPFVTVYGDMDRGDLINTAAVCPGSGGSTMKQALLAGADIYISGDIGHHDGIDAVACDMAVIDAGHYGIEHIFMEFMEAYLKEQLGEQLRVLKAAKQLPNCIV